MIMLLDEHIPVSFDSRPKSEAKPQEQALK
jgi:hypothetical protein